jgi:hypothetical protein
MIELSEQIIKLQPGTLWRLVVPRIVFQYVQEENIQELGSKEIFFVLSSPIVEIIHGIEHVKIFILTKEKVGFIYFHKNSLFEKETGIYLRQIT